MQHASVDDKALANFPLRLISVDGDHMISANRF